MGKFTYGDKVSVEFDDRLLAHLQAVITMKLRRGESCTFSWHDDVAIGGGRTTVWLHPESDLTFKYFGGRTPPINRDWVEQLMLTANTVGGLRISPEPAERFGPKTEF